MHNFYALQIHDWVSRQKLEHWLDDNTGQDQEVISFGVVCKGHVPKYLIQSLHFDAAPTTEDTDVCDSVVLVWKGTRSRVKYQRNDLVKICNKIVRIDKFFKVHVWAAYGTLLEAEIQDNSFLKVRTSTDSYSFVLSDPSLSLPLVYYPVHVASYYILNTRSV